MKAGFKSYILLLATSMLLLLNSCVQPDKNTVIDSNVSIFDLNWSYVNKIRFDFKIDDSSAKYNLFLNLRITPNYRYSNIFILIHQTSPDKKTKTGAQKWVIHLVKNKMGVVVCKLVGSILKCKKSRV